MNAAFTPGDSAPLGAWFRRDPEAHPAISVITLRRPPDSRDGPIPPLLLTLTVVTGLVDATSFLKLGHAFVPTVTGNIVFLGFGIAGGGGISRSGHR
jgi:uncharacterized protein DUF1275